MSVVKPEDVAAAVRAANDIREADAAQDIRDEYRIERLAQLWSETLLGGAVEFPPEVAEFVRARVDRLVAADTVVRVAASRAETPDMAEHAPPIPAAMLRTFEQAVARGNGTMMYRVWSMPLAYDIVLQPGHCSRTDFTMYALTLLTRWRLVGVSGARLIGDICVDDMNRNRRLSEVDLERATRGVPAVVLLNYRDVLSMRVDVNGQAVIDNLNERPRVEFEGWVAQP